MTGAGVWDRGNATVGGADYTAPPETDMPRRTAPFLAAVLTLAGCGSSTYADLSGTVDGNKFTASTFFWGGPFLIFTSNQQECIDFAWVKRGPTFENGGEAPNTGDMSALLFTFEGSDVTTTNTLEVWRDKLHREKR